MIMPSRGQLSLAQVGERRGSRLQTLVLERVLPFHIGSRRKLAMNLLVMGAGPGKPELKVGCPLLFCPRQRLVGWSVMWLLPGTKGTLILVHVTKANICVCVWYVACATGLFGLGE